jgi:putative holliday junction resolvase
MSGLIILAELAAALTPQSRLLGLDLGSKTIGMALVSLSSGIATPVMTIRRTKFQADARAMLDFAAREQVTHLVLGLPYNMDGTEGSRAQSTRAFVRNLQPLGPPPVLLFDERLTSNEAEDRMRSAGMSAARRQEMVDAVAAAVILESALAAVMDLVDQEEGRS